LKKEGAIMPKFTRKFSASLVLGLIGAAGIGAGAALPSMVDRLSHAQEASTDQERGAVKPTPQQLATANDLSSAFRKVAKSLRSSVVSIKSVQNFRPAGGESQDRPLGERRRNDEEGLGDRDLGRPELPE
jgi:hypothetical protein